MNAAVTETKVNTNGNNHIVEVIDVVKSFQVGDGEVTVLKGLSLDVENGEFISIVGPSDHHKTGKTGG